MCYLKLLLKDQFKKTMKIKKKQEISDRSDSDSDDSLHSNRQNSDKIKKSKSFSEHTPSISSTNEKENADDNEEPVSNSEDSGSEFSSEKISHEIENHNCSQNSVKEKSVKSIFNIDNLTADDEIYMLQCPENYSKQDLCDKNIDLTKSELSVSSNGEVYKLELINSDEKFITLAIPRKNNHGSLVKLPFKGHIIIQKDISMSTIKPDVEDCSDSFKIAFPSDIKVRHPLLGADWKSHINLANDAISKSYSKKKKKKMKQEKSDDIEIERKKLKRKHSESEIVVHKKKKKRCDS